MDTLKTVLHAFNFDLRNAEEKASWMALKEKLAGVHRMHSHDGGKSSHYWPGLDGATIELKTEHLFNDQWNTGPIAGHTDIGLRVFDFATDAIFNPRGIEVNHIRRGHWLEQTDAMREIRHNNVKCGYCGHMQRIEAAPTFCDRCFDSEYLAEKDLLLLRLRRIDDRTDRPEITDLEKQLLVPKWIEAQTRGTSKRALARRAKEREELEKQFHTKTKTARDEYAGKLWLWEHNINTDNVIFYDHREGGLFSFGWRKPLEGALLSALLDCISEFRFPYEIKCVDGRTLNGNIG
jgi:hypothetical protein